MEYRKSRPTMFRRPGLNQLSDYSLGLDLRVRVSRDRWVTRPSPSDLRRLSAIAVLVNYWLPATQVNNAVWIAIAYVVIVCLNLTTSGVYGETEFIFSSIKVLTIIGLISRSHMKLGA